MHCIGRAKSSSESHNTERRGAFPIQCLCPGALWGGRLWVAWSSWQNGEANFSFWEWSDFDTETEHAACCEKNNVHGGIRKPWIWPLHAAAESEIGASPFVRVLLTFFICKMRDLRVNEGNGFTGFKMAADFWSQGMFWENINGKADLKKRPVWCRVSEHLGVGR